MNSDIKKLKENYIDESHPSFLRTNTREIYNDLRNNFEYDTTLQSIHNFKTETEEISKQRQYNLLRGQKRLASFRQV